MQRVNEVEPVAVAIREISVRMSILPTNLKVDVPRQVVRWGRIIGLLS